MCNTFPPTANRPKKHGKVVWVWPQPSSKLTISFPKNTYKYPQNTKSKSPFSWRLGFLKSVDWTFLLEIGHKYHSLQNQCQYDFKMFCMAFYLRLLVWTICWIQNGEVWEIFCEVHSLKKLNQSLQRTGIWINFVQKNHSLSKTTKKLKTKNWSFFYFNLGSIYQSPQCPEVVQDKYTVS